jgi:hypothetical protein
VDMALPLHSLSKQAIIARHRLTTDNRARRQQLAIPQGERLALGLGAMYLGQLATMTGDAKAAERYYQDKLRTFRRDGQGHRPGPQHGHARGCPRVLDRSSASLIASPPNPASLTTSTGSRASSLSRNTPTATERGVIVIGRPPSQAPKRASSRNRRARACQSGRPSHSGPTIAWPRDQSACSATAVGEYFSMALIWRGAVNACVRGISQTTRKTRSAYGASVQPSACSDHQR